jgi:eukaryotic-like serine/threonine-protein kinase
MAWADVIEAGLHHLRGQTEAATLALGAAEKSFAAVDMPLHAACAQRRRGELTRDSTLIATADTWMAGQKIVSPARMSDVMAPGFCG